MAAVGVAVLAVVTLWTVPRLQSPTGTLVVVAAGQRAGSLPSSSLSVRRPDGSWVALGNVSGTVPTAPQEQQLTSATVAAGRYDAIRLGDETIPVPIAVTAGQVEPILLGIESGHVMSDSVYAGNDDVNIGLGELSGSYVPLPAFQLLDQRGAPIDRATLAGKDVVVAAFHTTCHETCPLYTALLLQLAKHLPSTARLLEVTTDPNTDSAAALSDYAKQIGASWTFATGTEAQVSAFWTIFDVQLATGDAHTSTLALIDRHGYVRLVYRGVPKVGNDIPAPLVTELSAQGLHELGSGGDGWGAPDVLQALTTISRPEQRAQSSGGKAANFTLASTDGSRVSLSELSGRPVVINFWASYCAPCKAEMPLLARSITSQSGIGLILVNEGDSADSARSFLGGLGIHQSALLDSDTSVLRSYGLSALPTTIFVRADGTIDRRQVGQLDDSVLRAELSILVSQ